MIVQVNTTSLQGRRETNEDKHDVIINGNGKKQDMINVNYFAVFDGHGGDQVSKYIQKNTSKYFMSKRLNYPLNKKYIVSVFDKIQSGIKKENIGTSTGSTALIVVNYKLNNDEYLTVINAGDCRCILCRDNFAMPLTKDHKPYWPEEKTRIEKLGGKIIFDQYDWRIQGLSVSRSFGDIDATPYLTHRPDVFRYKLDKHDKFFVLACDGLWDVLSSQDVVNFILLNCYDPSTNIRINKNINIAEKLAKWAIKKNSGDNITAIVVFIK